MISIIVVTYNSQDSILECLKSVVKNKIASEIIVVDNNSTDLGLKKIKEARIANLSILTNSKNLGFTTACNQGLKISRGKYLLFLNPDAILKPNTLKSLISCISTHPKSAAITCKILNPNGSIQPTCGSFPNLFNIVLDKIPIINKVFNTEVVRNSRYYLHSQHPDWISGACMLIRRSAINQVGLFDERYFMYVEDVDWCYRARKAGFDILYTPQTSIVHFDQGKLPEKRVGKFVNIRKGFLLFFSKYRTRPELVLLRFLFGLESLIISP